MLDLMAHGKVLMLLVCVTIKTASVNSTAGHEMCSLKQAASMKLSLDSLPDQVGNWISKMDFERGEGRDLKGTTRTKPWTVLVDAHTSTCEGGASTLQVSLTLTAPLPKASLATGYELFPDLGYYKFHNNATTWDLARQTCLREGAHLAIINSEKESEITKSLFVPVPNIIGSEHPHYAWIGLMEKGNDFFTIFGEELNSTGFERWNEGEPDSYRDGCGFLMRSTGLLGDAECSLKFAFICEQSV